MRWNVHAYNTFLERKSDKSNPTFFFDNFLEICYYIDVVVENCFEFSFEKILRLGLWRDSIFLFDGVLILCYHIFSLSFAEV